MIDNENIVNEVFSSSMPFESWLQLTGETSRAFSAFCVYRDLGTDRSIISAFEISQKSVEQNKKNKSGSYKQWCNWSTQFHWKDRAAAYDRYLEQLKQTELRKTIEAQGEKHRAVTGKMLDVVSKKLDLINPNDLTQGTVTEWVSTAIKAEREAAGLTTVNKTEQKQGEFSFVTEFKGL